VRALQARMRQAGLVAALIGMLAASAPAFALTPPACPSSDLEPSCVAEWHRYFAEADQEAEERKASEGPKAVSPAAVSPTPNVPTPPSPEASVAPTPPTPLLTVVAHARRGGSSTRPGRTDLFVTTTPKAKVTITLQWHRQHYTQRYEWAGTSEDLEVGETLPVNWSCRRPGAYRYTVVAQSGGATLSRSGRFSSVSVGRCAAMKRHEREARERAARQYAEEVARQRRELREGTERFEHNCRVEGGTPIRLETSGESVPACRAPGGGLLPVPVQG
jgi:hypothetical protein